MVDHQHEAICICISTVRAVWGAKRHKNTNQYHHLISQYITAITCTSVHLEMAFCYFSLVQALHFIHFHHQIIKYNLHYNMPVKWHNYIIYHYLVIINYHLESFYFNVKAGFVGRTILDGASKLNFLHTAGISVSADHRWRGTWLVILYEYKRGTLICCDENKE